MSFLKGLKEVYSKPSYWLLMIFAAFLFYLLSVIITDFNDLKILFNYSSLLTTGLIISYFVGFPSTIGLFSAVSMLIIALLFGSYLSLATYKTKQIKKMEGKTSLIGSLGIFFGVLAPGCAACGLGLASLFGLGGFIVALPFHGLEVSVIAMILLVYANYRVSKKINQNTCTIKLK